MDDELDLMLREARTARVRDGSAPASLAAQLALAVATHHRVSAPTARPRFRHAVGIGSGLVACALAVGAAVLISVSTLQAPCRPLADASPPAVTGSAASPSESALPLHLGSPNAATSPAAVPSPAPTTALSPAGSGDRPACAGERGR